MNTLPPPDWAQATTGLIMLIFYGYWTYQFQKMINLLKGINK